MTVQAPTLAPMSSTRQPGRPMLGSARSSANCWQVFQAPRILISPSTWFPHVRTQSGNAGAGAIRSSHAACAPGGQTPRPKRLRLCATCTTLRTGRAATRQSRKGASARQLSTAACNTIPGSTARPSEASPGSRWMSNCCRRRRKMASIDMPGDGAETFAAAKDKRRKMGQPPQKAARSPSREPSSVAAVPSRANDEVPPAAAVASAAACAGPVDGTTAAAGKAAEGEEPSRKIWAAVAGAAAPRSPSASGPAVASGVLPGSWPPTEEAARSNDKTKLPTGQDTARSSGATHLKMSFIACPASASSSPSSSTPMSAGSAPSTAARW
mmetsp:Transcript_84006/g.271516  ORF Transcript_84006/g.271516 Transcript_84006/m.271516 type:complete len:326 (-) Transcript_84006:517-1494(-)